MRVRRAWCALTTVSAVVLACALVGCTATNRRFVMPPPPTEDLSLNAGDVKEGMASVKGRVMGCGESNNGSGTVTVKLTISGAGSVTSATATGGSPALNACVEKAVKSAKFKKTKRDSTSVKYPFSF